MGESRERANVDSDVFLVLFIPLLILISKFVPKFSAWTSKRFFGLTNKEAEQVTAAMKIRKEMNSLSMVDEFAKYAKLQRKLNQVTLDLESTAECRKLLQDRVYKWIMTGLSITVGITYILLLAIVGTSTPVFVVPKYWFFPIHSLLSYPTGIDGAISIPIWTVLTRNVLTFIVKT